MPEQALESELNIDPDHFETVFHGVWEDENPEDRVHVTTEVETETIRVVDEWADQVHETAGDGGRTDGLFLMIQGAEATGKTTMTRYIKNSLSAVDNPSRRDIPLIIPIYDNIDPNQTPYKYRSMLTNEGRRVFEALDDFVPNIDEKIAALNSMSAELPDEHVERLADAHDATEQQVKGILGTQQSGGDQDPKEVVSDLAEEGFVFLFVMDEMVSSEDKAEAQSIIKWFKDHLSPYVGFVLFCHPDVSDAIRGEMRDQLRRRNYDASLEIAGQTSHLNEDILIDIRGEQDRIIDLHLLLQRYFAEVSLDGVEDYGPFNESNVEWMNSLLQSGGLIGNLIDSVKRAIKDYARALADGDDEKDIGVYLFDECSRMEHVRVRERLESTDIDPRADDPIVWRAKELITGSIEIGELESDEVDELQKSRVLFEDSELGELQINPSLVDYETVEPPRPTQSPVEPEEGLLDVYQETLYGFTDRATDPDEQEELRRNIGIGVSTLVSHLNSRQVNIANRGGLALPGQSHVPTEYMELASAGSTGRANKLQIADGEYSDYEYSFLTYALLDTESLSSPQVRDNITDLYGGENGILLFTDKDREDIDDPDWFDDDIDRQRWDDPAFQWGDIIEIVHVDSLREVLGVYQHISNQGIEEDNEVLAEIDRIDSEPTTPQLYELLDDMYNDIASSIQAIHNQIYAKYDGPTLPEAEAFIKILEEVQEKGFISQDDVDQHREEYGFELDSLEDNDAIIVIDGDDSEPVVFLQKDFGHVSKLADLNVNSADDLFPVPAAVFDELEHFREIEDSPQTYEEDDIEDSLSTLEDRVEWIDYFLFDEDVVEDIIEAVENTDVDVFSDVTSEISDARDTEEEDYNEVCDTLSADRNLWDQISELDVDSENTPSEDEDSENTPSEDEDSEISPIHRGLFYAKLHEEAPPWAEDYLDTDGQYPDLFFDLHTQINTILEELDNIKDDVENGFANESDDFSDLCEQIAEFMVIDLGNDNVELNNSDADQVQEKDLDALQDVDFDERISAIADNEQNRSNLSRATRFLSNAYSTIEDDLEDGLDADSIEDMDVDVAEEYVPIGKAIARRLIEDKIVFKDTSAPDLVVGELEQFCENLKKLVRDSKAKKSLERNLDDQWERIENISGDTIDEKKSYLDEKEEALEEAKRLLKLKDGHCDLCQTEWENLTDERREEITAKIEGFEEHYDISLSLDTVDNRMATVDDQQDTVDSAGSQISSIRDQLDSIDLEEYHEELSDLQEKYESDD